MGFEEVKGGAARNDGLAKFNNNNNKSGLSTASNSMLLNNPITVNSNSLMAVTPKSAH